MRADLPVAEIHPHGWRRDWGVEDCMVQAIDKGFVGGLLAKQCAEVHAAMWCCGNAEVGGVGM